MKLILSTAVALVAMTGMAMAEHLVEMRAVLSGSSEVPAVDTAGMGEALVTVDTTAKTVTWTVTHAGLSGDAKAAHFHGPAAEGENAGVVVDLGAGGAMSPMAGTAQLDDAQLADLMAGKWYVNIHTEANGGGEIRGQVLKVQ